MKTELHESSNLCLMTQELAEVASRYQFNQGRSLQLKMHSDYGEDWDELFVIAEDDNTGKQWQIVKIKLTKLSKQQQPQLNLQIEMYNNTAIQCAA